MHAKWLILGMLTVLPGCVAEAVRPAAEIPRPPLREAPRAPAPVAPNATLDEVFRRARNLLAQGHGEQARAIVQARVVDPLSVKGAAAEENARLLALLGEISAAERPSSEGSLFRAEAYFAWAISADPCMGEYWHEYIRLYVQRLGYANVLARLENKEPAVYPATAIGFSRGSRSLPWTDYWLYLRALIDATNNDYDKAVKALLAFKKTRNTCPVDQTLGEVFYAMHRYRDAVTYLTPATETVPGRRSAVRYYTLGIAQRSLGDYAAARRALIESSRLDPTRDEPNRALSAIDWELTGDPAIQNNLFRETLSEHPSEWNSWAAFWETRFRSGVAPVEEYRKFAAQTARAHSQVSQPYIAEALTRVWESDCAGAAKLLAEVPREAEDSDLSLARFLVAACRFDTAGAQSALDALEHQNPDLSATLRRHGVKPLITSLGVPGNAEEKARHVGEFLLDLSHDPAASSLAASFAQTYVHGIQKDPAGARAAVDALATEQIVLGRRQVAMEWRLVLDEEQIKSLSEGALDLLRRIKGVEHLQVEQGQKLVLVDADLRRLTEEAQRVAASLRESEQRLAERIQKRDRQITEGLELLAREIEKDQGAFTQLAGQVEKSQGTINQLKGTVANQKVAIDQTRAFVSPLMQWKDSPPEIVAQNTVRLSDMLSNLGSMVSVGPRFGPLSLNLLPPLAKIAKVIEKKLGIAQSGISLEVHPS
jgi:tetratricopeptide (TPR) repeat protein